MNQVRASDEEQLECLLAQQRTHVPVDGLPTAAKILGLPLFIGDAQAAKDTAFLNDNHITHVVSLGTGRISPETCNVLTIDVLDMEDQLILVHLDECLTFLRAALANENNAVLVHCVYGQSRSASICVAFLMAERQLPMGAAYNAVHAARPCIYINPGFLRQLQLFERMGNDANLLGETNAHAQFRALLAAKERMEIGAVRLRAPLLPPPATGRGYSCSKCNYVLGAEQNEVRGNMQ